MRKTKSVISSTTGVYPSLTVGELWRVQLPSAVKASACMVSSVSATMSVICFLPIFVIFPPIKMVCQCTVN